MLSLQDKTVVIIGGSSGIGFEIARQARGAGAAIVITGRDEAKLASAAAALAGAATTGLDAHDDQALKAFFARLPAIDHLVSMVGDSMAGGFLHTREETMRHVIESKFFTNWRIARLSIPKIRDGGSLVFTSGTGGRAQDASASYVANLGIGAMVQGLAVETAPRLRVNAIAPTFMNTAFWSKMPNAEREAAKSHFAQAIPLKRLAFVEEVASGYLHLLTNAFITGQTIAVDGGVMLVN